MAKIPRLSEAHIRLVHRDIPDSGPLPGFDHFTEAQYDEHLREFLEGRPDGPLEVFAYGSLIWKPVFEPAQRRRGTALGWERRFCLKLKRFRGTPEIPGLMMQIDRGGICQGVLHMVPPDKEWETLSLMWRREMTVRPPGNCPRWIEVETVQGMARAIAFTANPESPNYAGHLPLEEVAQCLSHACGHWGSGAGYLLQTVMALEQAGIHDPHLWALQERVAELIEARASR